MQAAKCARCRSMLDPRVLYAFSDDLTPEQLLCKRCAERVMPNGWSRARACRRCGRLRFYHAGWPRSYCTDDCARQARREQRRHPRRHLALVCIRCGRQYSATRSDSRYCSAACRLKAFVDRKKHAAPV